MIGLVHRLLFKFVEQTASLDAVAAVKRRAEVPLERDFRWGEAYDDAEWRRLLAAAIVVLEVPPDQAIEAFGRFFYEDALTRWPTWFEMSQNAREFLERQPRIHNGFATGLQDPAERKAINEKFQIRSTPDETIVRYVSPNQLCGLYKALARCIIDHFEDTAIIEETRCLKQGDPHCEIHIYWQ